MKARTRAEQRAGTERRILAVARRRFAANGYDRASLRAIARDARVDPSLVMQYFGSKGELFARVVAEQWPVTLPERGGDVSALVGSVLNTFLATVNEEGGAAVAALLRSSLTHPQAAKTTRELIFNRAGMRALSGQKTRDRELRSALVIAMLLGVHVARTLLGVKELEKATAASLRGPLEAAVHAVLEAKVIQRRTAAERAALAQAHQGRK